MYKKLIPIEPIIKEHVCELYGHKYVMYSMWRCPSCGKSYELDSDERKYCSNCGQAISFEINPKRDWVTKPGRNLDITERQKSCSFQE